MWPIDRNALLTNNRSEGQSPERGFVSPDGPTTRFAHWLRFLKPHSSKWSRQCFRLAGVFSLIMGSGLLPQLALAQEKEAQTSTPSPSFAFDALLVCVLFGLALFVICRGGRRN